jgi:hypothetical protein
MCHGKAPLAIRRIRRHAYDRNWNDRSRDARRRHGDRRSPNLDDHDLSRRSLCRQMLGQRDQTGAQREAKHKYREQHQQQHERNQYKLDCDRLALDEQLDEATRSNRFAGLQVVIY